MLATKLILLAIAGLVAAHPTAKRGSDSCDCTTALTCISACPAGNGLNNDWCQADCSWKSNCGLGECQDVQSPFDSVMNRSCDCAAVQTCTNACPSGNGFGLGVCEADCSWKNNCGVGECQNGVEAPDTTVDDGSDDGDDN